MWRRALVGLGALALVAGSRAASPPEPPPPDERAKEPHVTRIQVVVGDQKLPATLDDSAAARDFAALLPLDLELTDYAGTEKVAPLPKKLDTTGAPAAYAARAGDLTYYAPWGNLAIFYRDFRSASGLVRLGAFDADIDALLAADGLRVRIEAAPVQE